jgi:replicative DNA helicase
MVIFLYREAYYDKEARDADGNSLEEVATISVAKNRNGRTDSFNARFIGKYVKYCDWDDQGLSSNTMRYADIKNKQADDFGDTPTMTVPSKMNHIDREEFFKDDVPPAGGVDDFDDLD